MRCGAHGELGMRTVLWAHELGMRTDNAQDCLTPFPQPNSGPAVSLHLLIFLKRTGGWGPCLSDLSCPKGSSCSLIPGACFPKSCLGHLGEPLPSVFPSVFWSLMLQTPSVWAAQGDIRAPLGMLLENYMVLPQYQSFPVSPSASVSPAEPCCLWDRGQKV